MKTDQLGKAITNSDEIFTALYNGVGIDLTDVELDDQKIVDQYNSSVELNADPIPLIKKYQLLDIDLKEFDKINQANWFMPKEYKNIDIEGFLVDECPKQNYERLVEELELFRQHNMIEVLKYLKYLVDTMRSNNIVWGVGRGSSVASYCLYLLGIHKIDSIKYDLDIREFLK
jgi:DNA polymerase III alpha subunit